MKKFICLCILIFITISVSGKMFHLNQNCLDHAEAKEKKYFDLDSMKPVEEPANSFPNVAPNDTEFKNQWNLDDYGREYVAGTGKNAQIIISNHGIQAQKAWKLGYSGAGVKIAIIGYGVAFLEVNTGMYKFKVAPDFKKTKFDYMNAKDYTKAGHPNTPVDISVSTNLVAIMAASTNDKYGCAGIAYNAEILPIRLWKLQRMELDTGEIQGMNRYIDAINHSVKSGARIIYIHNLNTISRLHPNNPYHPESINQYDRLHLAIQEAIDAGVVVVCSCWPIDGYYIKKDRIFPAAYPEVISVGVSNFNGIPTEQSVQGEWLDLIAPGGDLQEDLNGDRYNDGILSQNINYNLSFAFSRVDYHGVAGAQVAAIIALMLEKNPHLTPKQVRDILIRSTKHDEGITYPNDKYGYGLVDAYGALMNTPNP